MKLPLFVPVMQSDQSLNQNLLGVGRNLSKERELAVAELGAIKSEWAKVKPQAQHANL
jgi:hypothetical protein